MITKFQNVIDFYAGYELSKEDCIDHYDGFQLPPDPYAGYDPIIETMRELHRIEMESWQAAIAEFEQSNSLVTEPVTTKIPHPDCIYLHQAPAWPADTF